MSSKSMKCQETACDEPQRAAVWNVLCPDSTLTALICTHPEDTSPLSVLTAEEQGAHEVGSLELHGKWLSFRGLWTSLVFISLIREAPGTWLLGFYLGWGLFSLPSDNPGFHPVVSFRENDWQIVLLVRYSLLCSSVAILTSLYNCVRAPLQGSAHLRGYGWCGWQSVQWLLDEPSCWGQRLKRTWFQLFRVVMID